MPIFRWGNPLHSLPDLEREMDRWIKSMEVVFEGLRLGRPFPALNVFESQTSFMLTAELPGCNVDELDIHVADGKLTLKGVRAHTTDVPADRFRRSERVSGSWERVIALPERVDEFSIQAELTDGILKVHLPKLPATAPRQIRLNNSDHSTPLSQSALPHLPIEHQRKESQIDQSHTDQESANES